MLFMGFLSSSTLEQQPQALSGLKRPRQPVSHFSGNCVADLISSKGCEQLRVQWIRTWHSRMTKKGSFDRMEGANRSRKNSICLRRATKRSFQPQCYQHKLILA